MTTHHEEADQMATTGRSRAGLKALTQEVGTRETMSWARDTVTAAIEDAGGMDAKTAELALLAAVVDALLADGDTAENELRHVFRWALAGGSTVDEDEDDDQGAEEQDVDDELEVG
jgi:hypothetical protein